MARSRLAAANGTAAPAVMKAERWTSEYWPLTTSDMMARSMVPSHEVDVLRVGAAFGPPLVPRV